MKKEIFRMPVNIVKQASNNQEVLSIVNGSKSFSKLPIEEFVFVLLSVLQSMGNPSQELIDIMYSFVKAYEKETINVEISKDGSDYILYQTGKIDIEIGFAKKHNIKV